MSNVVAIMQPTYLPWCGYLSMMDAADTFILLDTVPVDTKSWQNRNRILGRDGTVITLTIPTHAKQGQILKDVTIANEHNWKQKHERSLVNAYSKCDHYTELFDFAAIAQAHDKYLADLTTHMLRWLRNQLGIETPFTYASDLDPTPGHKVDRIASLLKQTRATEFLATPGATFLEGMTQLGGVPIRWHHYDPVPYHQDGRPFVSHLSVVDLLARHGAEAAIHTIRAGRLPDRLPLQSHSSGRVGTSRDE